MMNIENNAVTTSQGTIINLSMSSEQDARNMVDALRNSCVNQFKADGNEMKTLKAATRNHLYVLLAAFCGMSFKFLEPAMEKFLVAVLGDYGLKPAPSGTNPFRPLADMLFGEWVPEITNLEELMSATAEEMAGDEGIKAKKRKAPPGTTATKTVNGKKFFFVPNRSAEKYAKVGRYAKSQNWNAEEIAEKIANFTGKMEGVLKADTEATKGTDPKEIETQELIDLVMQREPASVLDVSECGIGPADANEDKLIGLWAEIKDGEVLIRGVLPTSDAAIRSFIRKYANDNASTLWKEKAKSRTV